MTPNDVGAAYDAAAEGWRAGPERMYRKLAEAMADLAPVPLEGASVLDAGSGTGVAGDAARRRGARSVVAVDLAAGMLASASGPAAVGDLTRLPFRDGAFDLAAAAFSLNHFADPTPPMRELRRVAGALVAAGFAPGWDHPAKEAIDAVLGREGFVPPDWYVALKAGGAHDVEPATLEACATAAGFGAVGTRTADVDTGLGTPADLVAWRFGMAHAAPYVAGLAPDVRRRVRREAERAVVGMPPLVVRVLVLRAGGR